MDTVIPAGFNYEVWISASIHFWSEATYYDEPQAQFYVPTGIPAIADGFSLADMAPILNNK